MALFQPLSLRFSHPKESTMYVCVHTLNTPKKLLNRIGNCYWGWPKHLTEGSANVGWGCKYNQLKKTKTTHVQSWLCSKRDHMHSRQLATQADKIPAGQRHFREQNWFTALPKSLIRESEMGEEVEVRLVSWTTADCRVSAWKMLCCHPTTRIPNSFSSVLCPPLSQKSRVRRSRLGCFTCVRERLNSADRHNHHKIKKISKKIKKNLNKKF